MGPLDYQLLLAEIRAIRKELESQFVGLRQSFNEPASTAITTMPSPLPTPYHDDFIASDQIRIESGLTFTDPHTPLDAGQKLVQCDLVDIEDIPASAAFSTFSSTWATPTPVPPSASATAMKRVQVSISRVPVGAAGGVRRRRQRRAPPRPLRLRRPRLTPLLLRLRRAPPRPPRLRQPRRAPPSPLRLRRPRRVPPLLRPWRTLPRPPRLRRPQRAPPCPLRLRRPQRAHPRPPRLRGPRRAPPRPPQLRRPRHVSPRPPRLRLRPPAPSRSVATPTTLAFAVPCALAVAIGATDTTGCNSTTNSPLSLPQAPSTSTDNCDASTNRSTKGLGGAVDAVALAAASAAQVDLDSLLSTSHMTVLRSLDAHLNGLRALSDGLENLGDMETLNERQNFQYLRELPYCISLLVSFQKLGASYNSIVALPDSVGCLTKLQQLVLAANGLNGTSPSQLATLSDIKALILSGELPPTWPSRCSTLGGNRIECAPEEVQFAHECAADTGRARARPGRARLRRHRRTYGALRPQAPWLHCAHTVMSMFTHPKLPTSTSAALIACNVTEASTTAASTIAKAAVTTNAQSISIINTSYVDHAMAAFQPSVVVLHARAAGRGAALSARVATIAPASTSSSVPTSAHKLFSGPLNRYITMLFPTPVLDVLLLDCTATMHGEHQQSQKMAESSTVMLWPPLIHQHGIFTYGWGNDVKLRSPLLPPRSLSRQFEIQSTGVQLRPTPWPSFYSYAALVQWIKSLVAADDILPKPPWVSFDTGTLFTVDYNCSNPCDSLQYAWQLLLDGGIYTKAADVGADLVGKVERNIPEDDLRKPAVFADNVGDNVGDIAGMGYGAAVAALGMLSAIATLSDNAGGIAEMAAMSRKICGRTDALDAAGNTTATIGKGFAIGSAALVSLALFGAFVSRVVISTVDVLTPKVFIGLIVGAMLPYWFSVMTMKSVGSAALKMVEEVYR